MLHLLEHSVQRLEETATRVVAAQIAGLIALWTQLYTFEESVPSALAWLAWSLLVLAIAVLGVRITPRQLSAFLKQVDATGALPLESITEAKEAMLVNRLSDSLRALRDRLQRGVRASVALGLAGLGAVMLGYLLDQAFYGG